MPRYHKYGESHRDYSESDDEVIPTVFCIISLLAGITTFTLTLILFVQGRNINMRIEIQKDYVSSPILSISSNGLSDYSKSPLLLPSPICFKKSSSCKRTTRNLLSKTTIDNTVISFVIYMCNATDSSSLKRQLNGKN